MGLEYLAAFMRPGWGPLSEPLLAFHRVPLKGPLGPGGVAVVTPISVLAGIPLREINESHRAPGEVRYSEGGRS